jgi:SAM-dependent methyltransferase
VHPEARQFVHDTLHGQFFGLVVEVGGRNINGGVRDLFNYQEYLSIDLEPGPDVDVVGDCREWSPPWPNGADLVVCCEVLEHTDDPAGVIAACAGYLALGGRLVVTCAGPGREPHSGHDGGPVRDGEHYANISPPDLVRWLHDAGIQGSLIEYHAGACDVYATGTFSDVRAVAAKPG